MKKHHFAKNVVIIGMATVLSRLLGVIREIFVFKFFDPWITDAFFVALRIPSTLRRLFAEGALSSGIVPVFSEWLKNKTKKEQEELAGALLVVFTGILSLVTLAGIIFSPIIVRIFAMGFAQDPAKMQLAVGLTRAVFPFLLFIGLASLFAGILNARKHFFLPALGPAVQNIAFIAAAVFICPALGPLQTNMVYGLAIGVIAGVILQVLIQIPAFWFSGIKFSFRSPLKNKGVKKVLLLMGPAAWGLGVTQVNLLVDQFLASWLGDGPISYLYAATRLYQLPIGIFAVSVSTVAFTHFSELAAEENIAGLKKSLVYALRQITFIMLCSGFGLIALGIPVIKLLFEYGRFSLNGSTMPTYFALVAYSAGMLAYGSCIILVRVYYSMKDMLTPVKYACVALISNIVLNLILIVPMSYAGLALATSISAFINMFLLFYKLKEKIGPIDYSSMLKYAGKNIALASLMGLSGAAAYKALVYLEGGATNIMIKFINVFLPFGVALAVIFILARLMKIKELEDVMKSLRRK
ncbi:MAG: murein biosynthesis integral membrane protein MurJ [Candidatus Aureabacteria bacterium]|nr:murein biosynthesis integral membrane protein MurJ [Candidatus Auribacterota bacterium]